MKVLSVQANSDFEARRARAHLSLAGLPVWGIGLSSLGPLPARISLRPSFLEAVNAQAKVPGPPATTFKRGKPGWRPRSDSAVRSARICRTSFFSAPAQPRSALDPEL